MNLDRLVDLVMVVSLIVLAVLLLIDVAQPNWLGQSFICIGAALTLITRES